MKKLSVLLLSLLPLSIAWADADVVLERHCTACHIQGVGGAPALNDKDAWAPRIATGVDAMTATVLKGKGAMPPKGTCFSCSDEELRAAVERMIEPLR